MRCNKGKVSWPGHSDPREGLRRRVPGERLCEHVEFSILTHVFCMRSVYVLEAFEERIPGVAVFARTACALERVERNNCSTGIVPAFDFGFDNLVDHSSR